MEVRWTCTFIVCSVSAAFPPSSFRLSFGALCDKEGGQVKCVCASFQAALTCHFPSLCESLLTHFSDGEGET